MDLHYTPSEIKEREFSKSISGYKKSEVNVFLEELAEQTESLKKQNRILQDKIEEQNKQLEKIEEQKNLLKRTLVLAEKLKDETLSNAKSEAQNIIKDAEISSRKKIQQAKDYLSILEHELINLKEKKLQFTSKFKIQLKTMLENLEKFEQDEENLKQELDSDKKTKEKFDFEAEEASSNNDNSKAFKVKDINKPDTPFPEEDIEK